MGALEQEARSGGVALAIGDFAASMIRMDQAMPHTDPPSRVRLSELLKKFSTAMLVTRASDGGMRARPLTFAGEHEGRLYFSTAADSPKVVELADDPRVAVTMQDSSRYISVSGTAQVSADRGQIDRLWRETWRVWFPEGKDDPSLRIVVVTPTAAEYWDQSGIKGIKYLVEMAKAYAKGTTPESGTSSDDVKVPL
jgi:general stress protein 26